MTRPRLARDGEAGGGQCKGFSCAGASHGRILPILNQSPSKEIEGRPELPPEVSPPLLNPRLVKRSDYVELVKVHRSLNPRIRLTMIEVELGINSGQLR